MDYTMEDKMFFYKAKEIFPTEMPFKIFRTTHNFEQAQHYHDYIQIWYVKHGECIHYFNGVPHKLTKGNIFVLPPNVPHSMSTSDMNNTELIGLEFLESFVNEEIYNKSDNHLFDFAYIEPFIVSLDKIKPTFHLDGTVAKTIEELLEETLNEYEAREKYFELFIKANLLKILAIITREYDKGIDKEKQNIIEKYKQAMNDALNYMRTNYQNKIYLEEVCRIATMSPTYFSYVFKQITGRTFTEYLNYLRIMKAKELLNSSNKTVSAISYEVGFNDPAYFDRVFKKEVGMSPGKFRKVL